MNEQQIKAARSLQRALRKCTDAGLGVRAYTDIGFYVLPNSEACDPRIDSDTAAFLEEKGMDCGHPHLSFDGGAGV